MNVRAVCRFFLGLGLLLTLLPLLGACNSEPLILLDIDPWPETGTRLRLRTQLNGADGKELTYTQNERRLAVVLPAGSDGMLRLDFSVFDSADCEIAVSSLIEPVPGGLQRASQRGVSFSLPPPHVCSVPSGTMANLNGVVAFDGKTFDAAGDSLGGSATMLRCLGTPPVCMPLTVGTGYGLNAIMAPNSSDAIVAGENGTIGDCSGTSCTVANYAIANSLRGVWASDAANIFAAGSGGLVVRCPGVGGTCAAIPLVTTSDLRAIHGVDPTRVFAVGANGTMLACNGSGSPMCTIRASNVSADLRAVFAPDPVTVWAVGYGNTILRCSPNCQQQTVNVVSDFNALYTTDGNNLWVVGTGGAIVRCMGSSCAQVTSGTTQNLYSVWGSDINTIFAVGDRGTVVRCLGTTCTVLNSVTQNQLVSVHGKDSDHVFAVGKGGAIVRYQP